MPTVTDKQEITLIPTLLIGMGGTGKETLLTIRKMFYEKGKGIGRGHALVDYLVLDTNEEELNSLNDSSLTPHMKEELKFSKAGENPEAMPISITGSMALSYLNGGKRQHPNIFSWLNEDLLSGDGGTNINAGAGQNRQIGRLCFFHHYKEIRELIKKKIDKLRSAASNFSQVSGHENQANGKSIEFKVKANDILICLVTSIAGGTGAGIFLDTAMLVRDILNKEFPQCQSNNIFIYAVLPEPYLSKIESDVQQKKIKANAFGVLRELEYFAHKRSDIKFDLSFPPPPSSQESDPSVFEVNWGRVPGPTVKVNARFWNNCFLVGGTNDNQAAPLSPSQVSQMIAETIYLNFDETEFGMKWRSNQVNRLAETEGLTSDDFKNQKGDILYQRPFTKAFSIFGHSQVFFDRAKLIRKAAYHLASLLIKEYWLRPTTSFPASLVQKALSDTVQSKDGTTRIIATGYPDDPIVSLGYDAIKDNLLMENQEQGATTWVESLKAEARGLRRRIELDEIDPLDVGPISEFMQKHKLLLETGRQRVGDSGKVSRDADQRRQRHEIDVEKRLFSLIRHRLREDGVKETEQIIKEYRGLFERLEDEARGVLDDQFQGMDSWESRLHNARLIPLKRYARIAGKGEMISAVTKTFHSMELQYLKAAANQILKIAHLGKRLLSESPEPGSLLIPIKRFADAMERSPNGVAAFLTSRFQELNQRQSLVGENKRTIGLLAGIREEELTLELKNLFKESGSDQWDWFALEKLVFGQLKIISPDRFRGVNDFGELLFALCKPDERMSPPQLLLEEFANQLTESCINVLVGKGLYADRKAIDQFFQEKADSQKSCLEIFCQYAAPFMQMNHGVVTAISKVKENPVVYYLGLPDQKSEKSQDFLGTLNRSNLLNINNIFQMRDDSIVLYGDRFGVPLCIYGQLDSLGEAYDSSTRKRDCHIAYNQLRFKLPEIRLVVQTSQDQTVRSLDLVLQGIVMDVLPFDQESKIFRFKLTDKALSQPVGGSLEELVDFFVDKENYLEDLGIQIEGKYRRWGEEENGRLVGLVAVLRAAMVAFSEELQHRLQRLIDQEKTDNTEGNPIYKAITKDIEPKIRERLGNYKGLDWIAPLLKLEEIMKDSEKTKDEQIAAKEAWKNLTEGCWKIVKEGNMWFPVINIQGRLKTK